MQPIDFYVTIPTLLGDTGARIVLDLDPERAAQRALDDAVASGCYSAADIRKLYRVQAHAGDVGHEFLLAPSNPEALASGSAICRESGRIVMI